MDAQNVKHENLMLKVVPIDPQTDVRWVDYINAHTSATIFHHPDWIQMLHLAYGYKPICRAVVEEDRVIGVLPLMEIRSRITGRRAVSLPFSDACGILCDDDKSLELLISHCQELLVQNGWKYVEFRGAVNDPRAHASSRYKSHTLCLDSDSEAVFRTFKKSRVQRSIVNSLRDSVTVQQRSDVDGMQEFIRLNAKTRKKLGVPPQPDKFFHTLHEYVISRGHGFVAIASVARGSIAASVFLHFRKSVWYKYGASDESYLRYHPNHGLLWDAIQWACERGYEIFDFGRTDIGQEGLLEFKRGWGTKETDLVYHKLSRDGRPTAGRSGKVLRAVGPVLRRMPISFLKRMGKYLYGHTG